MLRIAVCDDDKDAVQIHKGIVEDCLRQYGSIGEIAAYTSSDNLLYDITEDSFFFDLILNFPSAASGYSTDFVVYL